MRIHVEYFAQAREAAGCTRESVDLAQDGTLIDLVLTLVTKHGPRLAQLLLAPNGAVSRTVMFVVGEAHVSTSADVRLSDGDCVTIVSPISGG